MSSRFWTTSGTTLRMSATGTLLGMPAQTADGFDAIHPERWSNPPPRGVLPIIPCDEPDDESSTALTAPWQLIRARLVRGSGRESPEPLPPLPTLDVMPSEERELLTHSAIAALVAVWIIVALVVFGA